MAELDAVPDPEASALLAATDQLDQANVEWTLAVIEAVNTGASFPAIAALAGVDEAEVERLARRRL